jgi:putative two-component system response regulator
MTDTTNAQTRPTVLVVDDTPDNLSLMSALLKELYKVKVANHGERGLRIANSDPPPDLILLDIMMPDIDGYEVCARLKADPRTRDIPVIFLTARSEVEDFLRDKSAYLQAEVAKRTAEVQAIQDVTIMAMASLAETRDNETGAHIRRTQLYVRRLAEQLKTHPRFSGYLTERTIELLYKSAPLHDIGKVGIPDNILLKPGRLTPEEFEVMKSHTTLGHTAIAEAEQRLGMKVDFLSLAKEIALSHQEKWDGSGYPQALAGEAIPLSARLMALADVYDALISKRVYKPALPHAEAVRILQEGRAKHFDPDVVDAFLVVAEDFRTIAETHRDED